MTFGGGGELKATPLKPAGVASFDRRVGRVAQSVAEMSEDKSVAFQNKLAFASRACSSVRL